MFHPISDFVSSYSYETLFHPYVYETLFHPKCKKKICVLWCRVVLCRVSCRMVSCCMVLCRVVSLDSLVINPFFDGTSWTRVFGYTRSITTYSWGDHKCFLLIIESNGLIQLAQLSQHVLWCIPYPFKIFNMAIRLLYYPSWLYWCKWFHSS